MIIFRMEFFGILMFWLGLFRVNACSLVESRDGKLGVLLLGFRLVRMLISRGKIYVGYGWYEPFVTFAYFLLFTYRN